jgi:hypothetical protein
MYTEGCESVMQAMIGKAGGLDTVSGAWRQDILAGNVQPGWALST